LYFLYISHLQRPKNTKELLLFFKAKQHFLTILTPDPAYGKASNWNVGFYKVLMQVNISTCNLILKRVIPGATACQNEMWNSQHANAARAPVKASYYICKQVQF